MAGAKSPTLPMAGIGNYRHEACLYQGAAELLQLASDLIDDALAAGEPIMVALGPEVIEQLGRRHPQPGVYFVDIHALGRNPARIIPAWQDFIDEYAQRGRGVRGIGEPIWSDRKGAALSECQHHEALLNTALGDPMFWLVCPYDTDTLDAAVIAEAWRTHPTVRQAGKCQPSPRYPGLQGLADQEPSALSQPPDGAPVVVVGPEELAVLRSFVAEEAHGAGLTSERLGDLVLAANEIVANSLAHGGGRGTVRLWTEPGTVVCEVRDVGHLDDPMAGRRRPPITAPGGRGLWLANQLCDLVQIRSGDDGTVIRLHLAISRPG